MYDHLWNWLTPSCDRRTNRTPRRRPSNARPGLEILEERALLSAARLGLAPGPGDGASLPPPITDGAVALDPTPIGNGTIIQGSAEALYAPDGLDPTTPTDEGDSMSHRKGPSLQHEMSQLGVAVGPVAAPVRPPEGGFPSQIPWFQSSQPGPAAQPLPAPLSAALFPDYLDAALHGPSVSGKGADSIPSTPALSAHTPVAPASAVSAWLPAYLTSTDSEGGNSVGAARGVVASPPKGTAQALPDGDLEASTSLVAVSAATDEAFFAADHGADLPADTTTRAISDIVPGHGEMETHLVSGIVGADGSRKVADSGPRGAAVACSDHLFATLGSQTFSDGREDLLPPHASLWRQWMIFLTAEALTVYAAYTAADATERTPRGDGFPLPEEA
jgi:hypothetical protein